MVGHLCWVGRVCDSFIQRKLPMAGRLAQRDRRLGARTEQPNSSSPTPVVGKTRVVGDLGQEEALTDVTACHNGRSAPIHRNT